MSNASPRSRLGRGLGALLAGSDGATIVKSPPRYRRSAQMLQYLNEPEGGLHYVALIGSYRSPHIFEHIQQLQAVHGDRLCLRFISEDSGCNAWDSLWKLSETTQLRVEKWRLSVSRRAFTTLEFANGHPTRWECAVRMRSSKDKPLMFLDVVREIRQEMVNISDAVMFDRERYLYSDLHVEGKQIYDADAEFVLDG